MAFAFSSLSQPNDGLVKVEYISLGACRSLQPLTHFCSIVFVPAIGADPRNTWTPHRGSEGSVRPGLDHVLHDRLYPNAQIHLYDHLTREERKLEVMAPKGPNDIRHNASAEAFAAAEARIAGYGIGEWADRLLEILQENRRVQRTSQRPTLFLCHSTGGIVVKQALSRKPTAGESDIAALCLGVTFFATPHHGSSVLSEPEYVKTVQQNLGLKWEMSQHLRHELLLRNADLETLNYKFAVNIAGVRIISYVEGMDTDLAVLSTDDMGVESLTTIPLSIVDSRSGKLSTSEATVEDEDVIQLKSTHVGAPRFEGEGTLLGYYVDHITAVVKGYSAEENALYHVLRNDIMTGVDVDVHQFYESTQGMKIISTHPCLKSFLELGPTKCMEARLRVDGWKPSQFDSSIRPMIDIRRASEPVAPTLMVTTAETDDANHAPGAELTGHTTQTRRLQPRRLFPLPNPSSNRFKWIHVPFSHAGWVPHVLTTISQEKGDPILHKKVLMDKMWFSQHNRSVHASPHARFVRPSVRCLWPPSVERSHAGRIATPSSATGDVQVVVYLPYLHWDSFENLKKREEVIKRRREQPEALPVAKDVAIGRSMELKLIWQDLTSDRPIHCRRTLDQYGNPNLRNTSYRDVDQTLYKRTKAVNFAPPTELKHNYWPAETGKVLMVDQLWLWIMDDQTLVTFFASKEKEENDDGIWRQGDLRSEIYQDINGDYANQCVDPYDFAALVVFHAIKALPERATHRDLQVFRIFDEYISVLTESQIRRFIQFRDNQRFSMAKDRSGLPYLDNRDELNALLELRDVDDELTIITKLIKEQQACISDMVAQYHDLNTCNKGLKGIDFLVEAQQFLDEQKEQISEMLRTSQATQTAFKELLDMKQKHAIRISQEQTERAADSSRSIMVFTVFTIIFSPLSFFASVFGINAREWSGVETNPSLRSVFAYMVSISFALIVLALLFAFNKNMRQLSLLLLRSATVPIGGLVRQLCYYPRRRHHFRKDFDVEGPAATIRERRHQR